MSEQQSSVVDNRNAILMMEDFQKSVKVGDSIFLCVVPGWTFVMEVQSMMNGTVKGIHLSWIESMKGNAALCEIQPASNLSSVVDKSHEMEEIYIPLQSICWWTKIRGSARSLSRAAKAIDKVK